jgi:hypothetical protein
MLAVAPCGTVTSVRRQAVVDLDRAVPRVDGRVDLARRFAEHDAHGQRVPPRTIPKLTAWPAGRRSLSCVRAD